MSVDSVQIMREQNKLDLWLLTGLAIFFLGLNTPFRLPSYAFMGLAVIGLYKIFTTRKFDVVDRAYLVIALVIPCFYLLNMAVHGWDASALDRPLRLLWSVPIFYALRRSNISPLSILVILLMSALIMCVVGGFQVFWNGQERAFSGMLKTGPYGNYAAIFFAIGLFFLFENQKKLNIAWGASLGLIVASCIAMIISGTRSGWLGAVVMAMLIIAYYGKKESVRFFVNKKVFLVAVIGASILLVAGGLIAQRMALGVTEFTNVIETQNSKQANQTSIGQRIVSWRMGMDFFESQPVFGVGLANFKEKIKESVEKNHLPSELKNYGGLHNFVVDHLAKTGIVGTIGIFVFWYLAFKLFYASVKKQEQLGVLGMILLIGEIVFSSFGSMFASSIGSSIFIMVFTIFAALTNKTCSITNEKVSPLSKTDGITT